MERLAFLIPDMGGGGAEKVTVSLVNGAARRGYHVDLVLMKAEGLNLALVDRAVRIVDLQSSRIRDIVRPLLRYLRQERPTALQVSMWPLTIAAIIAARIVRSPTRLITTDHITLSRQYGHNPFLMALVKATIRLFYPAADHRVAVSKGSARELAALAGCPVVAIYNPIPPVGPQAQIESGWASGQRRILTVGEMKAQKNHVLLLDAMARLRPDLDAGLLILGEGELRSLLEQKAAVLGLQNRVIFPGHKLDPSAYYHAAELFVLSSDYEGFGNVIVEALSAGLPIVSTDCRDGPAEILDHGQFGLLVPCGNAEALAQAITRALDTPVDRERQIRRASDFREDIAIDKYLALMLGSPSVARSHETARKSDFRHGC